MSQADPSAEVQALSDVFAFNLTTVAALACYTELLIYDTLLTLPSEIKHIWFKTVKIGTILYLFARYLLMAIVVLVIYDSLSNLSVEVYYDNTLMFPCMIGVQGRRISTLYYLGLLLARTYAISLQNQKVLGVLGLLILSPTVFNVIYTNKFFRWNTISNVTVILFDTGVVMVPILSSIQTLWLWQKGEIWDKKSLISLMIHQVRLGEIWVLRLLYGIKPNLGGILGYLQNSFKAARQSVHSAIVAEFGNPHLSQGLGTETMEDTTADQESQQSPEEARSAGIELDVCPWVTGRPGDVEMAGQIASGSGRIAEA
ncbi:hypothetical protein JB92DRAFT_2832602 [Gautieria morchelliformis]|nr:hypothetical protein JB92DRAFT_2832602 [Gautieria morchelliformis]